MIMFPTFCVSVCVIFSSHGLDLCVCVHVPGMRLLLLEGIFFYFLTPAEVTSKEEPVERSQCARVLSLATF